MIVRKTSTLRAGLAVGALAFLGACSTAGLISNLPEQTLDGFQSALPAFVAEGKARPGANPGQSIKFDGQVLIAPVVYQWAPEGLGGRGFPPFWVQGADNGATQWMTDDIHKAIVAGFDARKIDVVTPQSLKDAGLDIDKLGDDPRSINGRSYDGGSISGYPYVSKKLKQWDEKDFAQVQRAYPGIKSVVFVEIFGSWIYKGHSKLNDEAIIDYTVNTVPKVKICTGGHCVEAKLAYDHPLQPTLFVPAEKADDEARRKANNKAAVMMAAKFNADVVLSFIDNLTK